MNAASTSLMTSTPLNLQLVAQQAQGGMDVRDEIVKWADLAILEMDDPPFELIELSLGKQDAVSLLNTLGISGDSEVSLRKAMLTARDQLRDGRLNLRVMLSALVQIVCRRHRPVPPDIENFAYW